MKNRIYFALIAVLASSCVAYQTGNMASTAVVGANYIYEDLAIGTAKSDRFWGLGGMRKDALLSEAKRQLMTARPLAQNEEYINFTVDFKRSFIFFLDRSKVTVTADVILYTDSKPKDRYSPLYLNKTFQVNATDNLFRVGDYIVTNNRLQGQILAIHKNQKATIYLKNKAGETVTKRLNLLRLYNRTAEYKGFRAGETYTLTKKGETVTGKIIGLGKTDLLIKVPNEKIQTFEYPD